MTLLPGTGSPRPASRSATTAKWPVSSGTSQSGAAATPEARTAGATEQHPPFGFIDTPREGDTVASGSPATGWALDDSGVARVEVSLDNGPAVRAELGQSFPGVQEAYPT